MSNQTHTAPAITFMNFSGDVTITWTPEEEAKIIAMVEKKMKEGYVFLIVKPRLLSFLGDKTVKMETADDIKKAKGLVVPNATLAAFTKFLDDADVAEAVTSGGATLTESVGEGVQTKKATSAREVARNQSIAIRPVTGG